MNKPQKEQINDIQAIEISLKLYYCFIFTFQSQKSQSMSRN